MRRAALAAALLVAVSEARAQGTKCADFLHEHDGSWRSFTNDEILLPRGPVPIHEGDHFSTAQGGPKGLIARILDAQCLPGGPLY